MHDLRINAARMQRDFEQLAAIGATGDGGVHRPALTESHLAARQWFRQQSEADGLAFHVDSAGNHSARLPAADPHAKTLLLGSHLDSVAYGGRFDGALGVITAYEVLRTVRDAGLQLPLQLEAIDFTDEEGTLAGLLGSRALAGALAPGEFANPRGGREALLAGLQRAGLTEAGLFDATRDPHSLAGYLEVHIEQGPRLIAAAAAIGIVTSLVGIRSFTLTFGGRADHAGTTPMDARKDAGLGAATLLLSARETVMRDFPDCVVNFGQLQFAPGAFNIVPATAEVSMECRAPDETQLDALQAALLALAEQSAIRYDLTLDHRSQGCARAAPCAPTVQTAFVTACDTLGLRYLHLTSGAGHDTQAMAQVCPAAMIFIPSTGGSHSAREFAEWDACVNGANVMLQAALELAFQK